MHMPTLTRYRITPIFPSLSILMFTRLADYANFTLLTR